MSNGDVSEMQGLEGIDNASTTPGHNLIKDPSFPEGSISPVAGTSWKINDKKYINYYGRDDDTWVGVFGGGVLSQEFDLPKLGGMYDVAFAYDVQWFKEACTLRVLALGGENDRQVLEITLHGEPGRDESTLSPSDPTWQDYTSVNIPKLSGVKRIRVEFSTPAVGGSSVLCLRRVVSRLKLVGLTSRDKKFVIDPLGDPIALPYPPAGNTLKVCIGASHRLEIPFEQGETWSELRASCLWLHEKLSPEDCGLSAEPEFNIRHSDPEEAYQKPTLAWDITSDDREHGEVGIIPSGLGSYWTAPVFSFSFDVGHHRKIIDHVTWDHVIPVVELGNSSKLVATVISPYTKQPLEGVTVRWTWGGKILDETSTDTEGKSTFAFKPNDLDLEFQNFNIRAEVWDTIRHPEVYESVVPVYKKHPLYSDLSVYVNGEEVYPSRDVALLFNFEESYSVKVVPRSGSIFIGEMIRLGKPDPHAPGYGVQLPEPAELVETGIEWTVKAGNERGYFNLQLSLEESGVTVPPLVLKTGQMSSDWREETEVTLDGETVDSNHAPFILWSHEERKLKVEPKSGSPIGLLGKKLYNKLVDYEGITSAQITGFNYSADLFESGAYWGPKGHGFWGLCTGRIQLDDQTRDVKFFVMGDKNLGSTVGLKVDGHVWDDRKAFVVGQEYSITAYTTIPAMFERYGFEGRLEVGGVVADVNPLTGTKRRFGEKGLEWKYTPKKSGEVVLNFWLDHFDKPVALTGRAE